MRGVVLLLGIVLLAGCSDSPKPPAFSFPSMPSPELEEQVTLEVVSAYVERGSCLGRAKAFEKECHMLPLRITLDGAASTPILTASTWQSVPDVPVPGFAYGEGGPDFLYPGDSADVTVRFERPEGSDPIPAIRYEGLRVFGETAVPAYPPGAQDSDLVRLEVKSAAIEPHACFATQSMDTECHRFRIEVDNSDHASELDIGVLAWTAVDDSGGLYGHMEADHSGPSKVAAGGVAEVTIGFDLEPGAGNLATVTLEDNSESITVSAALPAY